MEWWGEERRGVEVSGVEKRFRRQAIQNMYLVSPWHACLHVNTLTVVSQFGI